MSKNSVYNLIDEIGNGHDNSVLQWRDSLVPDKVEHSY